MTRRTTVVVLRNSTVIMGVYTNTLAAFNQLKSFMPKVILVTIPSYPTVNRRLQKSGDVLELPTSLGNFVMERHDIRLKAVL